jgi:hypothetical protein
LDARAAAASVPCRPSLSLLILHVPNDKLLKGCEADPDRQFAGRVRTVGAGAKGRAPGQLFAPLTRQLADRHARARTLELRLTLQRGVARRSGSVLAHQRLDVRQCTRVLRSRAFGVPDAPLHDDPVALASRRAQSTSMGPLATAQVCSNPGVKTPGAGGLLAGRPRDSAFSPYLRGSCLPLTTGTEP